MVGYDGSEAAGAAVDWAAGQAAAIGRALVVLAAGDRTGRLAERGADRARAGVRDLPVEAVQASGPAAAALLQHSRDAALLVLGTRGRGGLAQAVLGSVAVAVTAHASCPVVVIRGDSTELPGPTRPVVVGVGEPVGGPSGDSAGDSADRPAAGSVGDLPPSRAALDFAADVAAAAGAPLRIATVYRPFSQQAAAELTAQAADVVRRRYPYLTVTEHQVQGPTVEGLVTAAHRAGLLVVGTYGHGVLDGLLVGSVSHGALHQAECPVAVVRPMTPTTG
jgi:nucleotide-binding universal stress UspA family protein